MRPKFTADSLVDSQSAEPPRRPSWQTACSAAGLALGVTLIFAARLSLLPLVGEETRWATAAREMLATGDWVVPRQQGQVFPERPPLTIWLMALAGQLRGDVDVFAVRLPSILAIVLTSLLVFGYTRSFASNATAVVAGLAFATFGQVLQIGRLGESEAAFALFVGASLLLWHAGYSHGWPPLVTWTLGFTSAALGALVKGPQAPIYFIAITVLYLALERDWRHLFRWQALVGAAAFIAIIAAWQAPFYRRTDAQSVVATWAGLANDRIHLRGVLTHSLTYPLETFACLLPWSPMLVALAWPSVRNRLGQRHPQALFLVVALVVAYPTVWLAAGARGRYFMPLYPLVAVLVALVIETCAAAPRDSAARRAWHRFLLFSSAALAAGALFVVSSSLVLGPAATYQPRWFALVFGAVAVAAVAAIGSAYRKRGIVTPLRAACAVTSVAGLGAAGLIMNINAARWNDPTAAVAEFASRVPAGTQLASLTAIDHRFAYYYHAPIVERTWPKTIDELPAGLDYFCFMRHAGDSATARAAGRGRSVYSTPGTLPFAWQELATICTDRQPQSKDATSVVLGRVIRPIRATVSDATQPQPTTASQPFPSQRK